MNCQNKILTILRIITYSKLQSEFNTGWITSEKKETKHKRLAFILQQNLARCGAEFL